MQQTKSILFGWVENNDLVRSIIKFLEVKPEKVFIVGPFLNRKSPANKSTIIKPDS